MAITPDRYNAAEAEARWQKIWDERGIFATRNEDVRNKYYVLDLQPALNQENFTEVKMSN